MIEISVNKVSKNYGFNTVLSNISFDIKTNERVALIGSNGCGKTTLLKIIKGLETQDDGNVFIRKDASIGYLTQIPNRESEDVIANEVYLRGVKELLELDNRINSFVNSMKDTSKDIKELSLMQEEYRIKGGYELKSKIEKIKHGFKLSNDLLNTKYNDLSGGEKTIINLASLILSNPDILLLDEPTNHLDIETLEWFEEYINNYKGSIVIVSHDRYFLDKVVNKVICLEHGSEDVYYGNYTYFLEESEKRFILQFQKYKNQQKEIKAIKEAIKRLKEWGTKSDNPIFFKRAASMEKRLEKMNLIEKPKEKSELKLNLNIENRSANHVLEIQHLDMNIDNKKLLCDANLQIIYKDKVCLMGKNGCGKTTLIKNIINNTHKNIKLGANVKIGYIPQEIRFDNEELTIYEYVRSFFVGSESELRSKLHQFYFGEEAIDKKIKYISGGEKVRIKLLELILKDANFLILDEPTNHIDIDTKEILEESLLKFEGTILFISHDRYFINKIATKIVRIENNKLVSYIGSYEDIKNKQVINNYKETKDRPITINASNRVKEFIKDATKIEEVNIGCNSKVYKIRKKSKIFYLKIATHLSKESIKLDYLNGKINVPEKVFYEKYNGMSYLLTKEVKGEMLCSNYYMEHRDEAIDIIVESFNALYNIDYTDCIIDETIDTKIKRVEEKINKIKEKDINPIYMQRFHSKDAILKYLKGNKPKQIIGFTHGDMSLPNILALDNHFNGLIDVSDAGLSDIYYDLVICEKSIERNYGKEYIDIFYNKLGIEKDEFKSDYYRILVDML
ncbi:MAG: ribosomal protection-like ABC-F family protein [Bacilli bacterium]